MPHLLYFLATLLSALSLVISKFVESSLRRNPPTYTHHDECTLLNSITLGPGETLACSQTSRTNNETLTISTPLRVTQMRGFSNLSISVFPLSLWVM